MQTKTSAINKTAAPGAGAVLASLAGLAPNEMYTITVLVALGGAAQPAAADMGNLQLRANGVVVTGIPVAASSVPQQFTYEVRIPAAGGAVDVQAIAAGTASCTYETQIQADSEQFGA